MATRNLFVKYQTFLFLLFLGLFVYLKMPPSYDINNVSVDEASALVNAGAVVVDVRGKPAFDTRHIPGAINVPLEMLRAGVPLVLAGSKSLPVVVYCGDGTSIGPEATSLLNKAGYAKAVNVDKGIQGWASAGLKVDTSSAKGG